MTASQLSSPTSTVDELLSLVHISDELRGMQDDQSQRLRCRSRLNVFDIQIRLENGMNVALQAQPDDQLVTLFEHLYERLGRRYDASSASMRYRGKALNGQLTLEESGLPRSCQLVLVPHLSV
jgi:hypothetical protein